MTICQYRTPTKKWQSVDVCVAQLARVFGISVIGFMQLALAIQSGALAPSAVLAGINSYSTRNRFALALQVLGKAV